MYLTSNLTEMKILFIINLRIKYPKKVIKNLNITTLKIQIEISRAFILQTHK